LLETIENAGPGRAAPRPVDIFKGWWLGSFGAALALLYLFYFGLLYRSGTWLLDRAGVPIYTDFGIQWAAGLLALHGKAAALSDTAALVKAQAALFPAAQGFYPNWPYPPSFLLLLAPLALVPYRNAFILWDALTLLACAAAVYRIVGRKAAIALVLATPFTAWNCLAGYNGFLTAALIGAALLSLERRPLLAGFFIGALTYKPQFGILFPVALVAGREWRAIAAAAVTGLMLAALSALLFGHGTWWAFPRDLAAQAGINLDAVPTANWGYLQSVYGLARLLHGAAGLAWLAQGTAAVVAAVVVWRVWRSGAAYRLKAATLSAAALLATPYVFAYDLAALSIPAAFLAADQLERGLLPGDKAAWILLFGVPLAVLVTLGDNAHGPNFGAVPIGLAAALALFALILRRTAALSTPGAPSLRHAPAIDAARQ
jgi:arabinofuranan 3-O-arabinosyltransferase